MARRPDKDSATCQFFINHADNTNLDHKDTTDQGYGYAVFGKVVKGMDVVDMIAAVKTQNIGSYQNVPVDPVVIESVRLKK
jgi:cyclophilin family peptidyl-prolyl cis-trans isomerase